MAGKLKCPKCKSVNVHKSGRVTRVKGIVQRHFCRDCGHLFSRLLKPVSIAPKDFADNGSGQAVERAPLPL